MIVEGTGRPEPDWPRYERLELPGGLVAILVVRPTTHPYRRPWRPPSPAEQHRRATRRAEDAHAAGRRGPGGIA